MLGMTNSVPTVTLLVGSNAPHYQQVLTGFSMLAREGNIRLKTNFEGKGVMATIAGVRIFYDVQDGYGIESIDLDSCDLYFKRSYYPEYVEELGQTHKIKPLGLNYEVYPSFVDWRESIRNYRFTNGLKARGRGLARPIARVLLSGLTTNNLHTPARSQDPRALFLTRTWEPTEQPSFGMPDNREINCMRAECIRKIRQRFGDKCIAGFSPSPYAVEHFADLIAPVDTGRLKYIKFLKEFPTICIATTGLYGSIGWKMAEYVACSKAIISEKLYYTAPGFNADEHYLEFDSPDECVRLTEHLMDNPDATHAMQERNERYYQEYLRPDRLIARSLSLASSH